MLTNELFEVTVHAQPLEVATLKVALPPLPAMLNVVVEIVYAHVGVAVVVGDVGVDFFEHPATATAAMSKVTDS
jgi:hypothetical protein